jgi:N-acetylglucosaminyl-diphospho-decaprenol L-rhamnosyltransferase
MLLPVFVIHWNAPDWCQETVTALRSSVGVDVSITVIDNGSTRLPSLSNDVVIDRRYANIGYSGAANHAIELATAQSVPFFAVASHDVTVSPDCLEAMIRVASTDPSVGIVGPNFGQDTVVDGWVSGSLMLLRTACVRDVGMFDTIFGSYCEEVDYCHRASARGWQLAIAKEAIATTHGSRHPAQARLLMDANFTLLAAKEGDWRRVFRRIGGMAKRCITDPGGGWQWSLLLSMRQLARLIFRGIFVVRRRAS